MQFFLLIIFFTFYTTSDSKLSGFSLGRTDHRENDRDRDCLYYNAHDKKDKVFQIIEYCIRFQLSKPTTYNKNHHSWFTFDDLLEANINSHQLYTWSAPVDLIEHYQNYLEDKTLLSSKFLFYNCTYPWFGTRCEYSFEQPEFSFTQQVEASFETKRLFFLNTVQPISCYVHLQCDRAGDRGQTPGACLDWREVCNGKMDCLDGGHDEEQCWKLEFNECDNETEYRCHIGLCIPRDFLNDGNVDNADCLDQSDEGFTGFLTILPITLEVNKDIVKPIFRFEEHMCYSGAPAPYSLECGYLTCSSIFGYNCFNMKHDVLMKAFFIGAEVTPECYKAISCLMNLRSTVIDGLNACQASLISTHPESVKQRCPEIIKFPPIMFAHVRFVYRNNRSWVSKRLINTYSNSPGDNVLLMCFLAIALAVESGQILCTSSIRISAEDLLYPDDFDRLLKTE